jgi:hypothetical protein
VYFEQREREDGTRRGKCRSSRFPCFACRAACAGACLPTRCAVPLQRGRFLPGPADYEQRDTRSTKTPKRPSRLSPSNSGWEHFRSRGDSRRDAASVFPRCESEADLAKASALLSEGT